MLRPASTSQLPSTAAKGTGCHFPAVPCCWQGLALSLRQQATVVLGDQLCQSKLYSRSNDTVLTFFRNRLCDTWVCECVRSWTHSWLVVS